MIGNIERGPSTQREPWIHLGARYRTGRIHASWFPIWTRNPLYAYRQTAPSSAASYRILIYIVFINYNIPVYMPFIIIFLLYQLSYSNSIVCYYHIISYNNSQTLLSYTKPMPFKILRFFSFLLRLNTLSTQQIKRLIFLYFYYYCYYYYY